MRLGTIIRSFVLILLLTVPAAAQTGPVDDIYQPPKITQYGEQEHYRYLSVIETDCETMEEVIALSDELRKTGALISIITSPKRILAWVPPAARQRVLSAKASPADRDVGVAFIGYSSQEINSHMAMRKGKLPDYNEADETIVDYLDFVHREKTPEELAEIEAMSKKIKEMQGQPRERDHFTMETDELPQGKAGQSLFGGPDPQVDFASSAKGYVVHTSFFVESRSGTGSYNWDNLVYSRYKNFYIAGINFWTSLASYYGQSLSAVWRLYGRTHPYSQVTGEPTAVGDQVYIPEVIKHITSATPPYPGWTNQACRYALLYNQQIKATYFTPFAFCAFISYKPTPPKSIHPTAWSVTYGNGDIEGIYFSSDTQYWQAGLNPFAASLRNCFAHEMGHLFGAPDEYNDTYASCNWSYRGMKNLGCQRVQPAYLRPGWTQQGLDGIMDINYIEGTSIATPVHTGLQWWPNASPVRCFKTEPAGIPYKIIMCDGADQDFSVSRCFPVSPDYCMSASVPPSRNVGGTMYYFDYWEIKRVSGSPTITNEDGPELSRWKLFSTRANPITEVVAHFTNSPPPFNVANNTLSAWLSAFNHTQSPVQAIMLRWRVKYDMSDVDTRIEYERTPGNWVELSSSNMSLGPAHQPVNKWTGVQIYSVPGSGGDVNIQRGQTYNFRIVGYFNSVRGANSNVASIKTRPASPADSTFAYDVNELNTETNPKVLQSSGPGMDPYTVRGATTIAGISGEFSWYIPKSDYYRLTAIDLTSLGFGENLTLTLTVRDQSNLRLKFRAKRVGTDTWIESSQGRSRSYTLKLTNDGEYLIVVEPQMFSAWTMYDIVDRNYGNFAVGEYEINVERKTNNFVYLPRCPDCLRLIIPRPVGGWLLFDPIPPAGLLLPAVQAYKVPAQGLNFAIQHIPPPGYMNEGFDGDLFSGDKNPLPVMLDPNTPAGDHMVEPKIAPIPEGQAELVLIYPEGPGGPFVRRTKYNIGETAMAEAIPPEGYNFVGWGYDSSAATNPLPVTMWRSKILVAYFRPKPCQEGQMTEWTHNLLIRNARQAETDMSYGMKTGAGDGLEAGQTDLPPTPPQGTYDVRWINIPGAQGSTTDIRAVKQTHIYQLRVQTGNNGTAPVRMTWSPPPSTPAASFMLTIPGEPAPIDMRATSSYTFSVEGTYICRLEVKAPACPTPDDPQDVTVVPGDVDPSNYPCIDMELIVRDRKTGELLPFYNPFNLKLFEMDDNGEDVPARISRMFQMDSTIWIRICADEDDTRPNRRIRVVTDDDDPDKKRDTTDVMVDIPVPQGPGEVAKTTVRYSEDWDMVSLPLDVEEELAMNFFTSYPSTQLYWFDPSTGFYENGSPMEFGKGYWIKTEGISVGMYGYERPTVEHTGLNGIGEPKGYGWNMIGAPSKSLSVAMISQNPGGGMKAIFGWDVSSGYIIPTDIKPGRGYWVRVDPGTTLKMEGTSFQGGSNETQYSKALRELDPKAWLEITTDDYNRRYLTVSPAALTAEQKDALMLPPAPAEGLFDVRAENRTIVLQPGMNTVSVQGGEELRFNLLHTTSAVICRVYNSEGTLLTDLSEPGDHVVRTEPGSDGNLMIEIAIPDVPEAGFALGATYPNPASASSGVTIPYSIDTEAPVSITIVDMLGRTIRTLVSGSTGTGTHIVRWDGLDNAGIGVPAGLYLCRMESAGMTTTTKISIVR